MNQYVDEVISSVDKLTKPFGNFSFEVGRYPEKAPHPFNQAAFVIKVRLPWQRQAMTKIKLEISRDETLVFEPELKALLHEYGEALDCHIQCYKIEEIIIEKFRAILQNQEKFAKKGWARSRVRDFYDLWRIFCQYNASIETSKLKAAFLKKCQSKNVDFSHPNQFFNETYLNYIKKDWHEYLRQLTVPLPEFSDVVTQLKEQANKVF